MLSTFALVGVLLGAPPGAVIIDVSPADAVVEVDGKPVKTGAVVKVAPGARKVKAQRKGYLSQTKVVTVKQNEKTRVKLKLAKVYGQTEAPAATRFAAGAAPRAEGGLGLFLLPYHKFILLIIHTTTS